MSENPQSPGLEPSTEGFADYEFDFIGVMREINDLHSLLQSRLSIALTKTSKFTAVADKTSEFVAEIPLFLETASNAVSGLNTTIDDTKDNAIKRIRWVLGAVDPSFLEAIRRATENNNSSSRKGQD